MADQTAPGLEADSPSSPRPDDAGSSKGSSAAANEFPFLGNPGPAHDPDAPPAVDVPPQIGLAVPLWQADRVRTILKGQGAITHQFVGIGQSDWVWQPDELEAIDEPLANVLNKFPITRAAAGVSDELTAGGVFFSYLLRSVRERADVIRQLEADAELEAPSRPQTVHRGWEVPPAPPEAQPPVPTGPPPPPGTEWQVG